MEDLRDPGLGGLDFASLTLLESEPSDSPPHYCPGEKCPLSLLYPQPLPTSYFLVMARHHSKSMFLTPPMAAPAAFVFRKRAVGPEAAL